MLGPALDDALAKTSRSFALSLRLLPGETRRAIALAYLFARAADTIADTRIVPREERLALLGKLASLVRTAPPTPAELATRSSVLSSLKEKLTGPSEPAERALLETLPLAFQAWDEQPALERALTERVLGIIVSGMERDLGRFSDTAAELRALETREELFDYCFRVAGCVGEFWTALHRARLPRLRGWDEKVQLERARRFGRALQLTNVLRDVPRDLAHGRCYLPRRELLAVGLEPEDLLDPRAWPRLEKLFFELVDQADADAREGWRYTLEIPVLEPRLRLATALPLLLAHPTLGLLRKGNPLESAKRKVSRTEVRRLALAALVAIPSNESLRRLFRRTAREAGFVVR